MAHLVGLSGSLRKASYNAALLHEAAGLMPDGSSMDVRSIRGIPLYDGDIESTKGIPAAVTALKDAIAQADGLLLVTPEYNNSIPGVFKNAIDWMTRPPEDIARVFGNKPVAIMGASTGGFGTLLSQNAWLSVLRLIGTTPWFGGRLLLSHAAQAFDAQGRLVDETTRSQLTTFMAGFCDFAESKRASGSQ